MFPLFFIIIETDGRSSREKVISNRNHHILKSQVYLPGLVTNLIGISPDSVEQKKSETTDIMWVDRPSGVDENLLIERSIPPI